MELRPKAVRPYRFIEKSVIIIVNVSKWQQVDNGGLNVYLLELSNKNTSADEVMELCYSWPFVLH